MPFPAQASEPWPPTAVGPGASKYDQAGRGAERARLFDGVNQWPALVGDAAARARGDALQRERVAVWHNEFAQSAARRRDLKLRVVPRSAKKGDELYNLSADPTERVNLIKEPRFAEDVAFLRGAAAAFDKTRTRPFNQAGPAGRCGPSVLADIKPF